MTLPECYISVGQSLAEFQGAFLPDQRLRILFPGVGDSPSVAVRRPGIARGYACQFLQGQILAEDGADAAVSITLGCEVFQYGLEPADIIHGPGNVPQCLVKRKIEDAVAAAYSLQFQFRTYTCPGFNQFADRVSLGSVMP